MAEYPQQIGTSCHHDQSGRGQIVFRNADHRIVKVEHAGHMPAIGPLLCHEMVLMQVGVEEYRSRRRWIHWWKTVEKGLHLCQPLLANAACAMTADGLLLSSVDECRPFRAQSCQRAGREGMQLSDDFSKLGCDGDLVGG